MMKKVRDIVASHLEQSMSSPEELKTTVNSLLLDLRFTLKNPDNVDVVAPSQDPIRDSQLTGFSSKVASCHS